MKRLMFATVALLLLGAVTVAGGQKGRGKQKPAVQHTESGDTHLAASVTFTSGEVRVIRDYYAPRYRSLPPGLQKKIARGGQLPPGWRKKLQPFPVEVERHLGPLPRDYGRGVIDGHAVIYNTRSQVVIDVTMLF